MGLVRRGFTGSMEPFSIIMLSLLLGIVGGKADVRCYCNEPNCVRTGYMCKSSLGCFTKLAYEVEGETTQGPPSGCIEHLPENDIAECQGEGDVIKTKTDSDEVWPILVCCRDDMCNYLNNLDFNVYVDTKSNGSHLKGIKSQKNKNNQKYNKNKESDFQHVGDSYHQRDLWFKAAVIAVPISGGFILVLLVLLAVRMLRRDSRRHHQLMQIHQHRSYRKAHNYVIDHFSNKNDTLNTQFIPNEKQNGVYKEVNVKLEYDHPYEQIRNTSEHGGSCSSMLIWGKTGSTDPSTHV